MPPCVGFVTDEGNAHSNRGTVSGQERVREGLWIAHIGRLTLTTGRSVRVTEIQSPVIPPTRDTRVLARIHDPAQLRNPHGRHT